MAAQQAHAPVAGRARRHADSVSSPSLLFASLLRVVISVPRLVIVFLGYGSSHLSGLPSCFPCPSVKGPFLRVLDQGFSALSL